MICPLMRKKKCVTHQCAWWVKLTSNDSEQGRCSVTWIPILLVELRRALEGVKNDDAG